MKWRNRLILHPYLYVVHSVSNISRKQEEENIYICNIPSILLFLWNVKSQNNFWREIQIWIPVKSLLAVWNRYIPLKIAMNVFKEELTQVDFPNFFSVFRFSATLQNWCGGCRQGCWGRYPFEFNVQNMGCKTCSCHNLVQWVKAFFGTASRSSGSTGEALFQSHFAFNFISYSTWSVTVTVLRSQKSTN